MDMLEIIFKKQRDFDNRVQNKDIQESMIAVHNPELRNYLMFANLPIEKKISMLEDACQDEGREILELCGVLPNGSSKWWKTPIMCKTQKEYQEWRSKVIREIIDKFHFTVSQLLKLDCSAKEAFEVYMDKNSENHSRQDSKY